MSQGNDFANYASSVEDRGSASEDVWFVAVSSDDIKQMSVDQLDEAFRLGVITAQTAVWTEGMEAWAPLGEVADLDSDGEAAAEPEAMQAPEYLASAPLDTSDDFSRDHSSGSHVSSSHVSNSHVSNSHASSNNVPSQRRTNPGWHNPFDAPVSEAPPAQHHSPGNSMGPSSFAPVTASYAPAAGKSLAQSTGPVALNVDEDMPPVNRGRRFRPERWLLAAAGVIAVGVVAFNNKDLFSSASSSVAAAEKQASAAALIAHPYEAGSDKSKGSAAAPAALPSADDGKDAPIGSLKGEAGDDEAEAAAQAAAPEPVAKPGSVTSKESLRGGFSKALSKNAPAAKPAKASKSAKASKQARKAPSRAPASKSKKGGVARAASAFDPLNGSLP